MGRRVWGGGGGGGGGGGRLRRPRCWLGQSNEAVSDGVV